MASIAKRLATTGESRCQSWRKWFNAKPKKKGGAMNSANQDKLMIEALVNLKGTLSILELSLHAATQEFQTVVDAQAVHGW